MEKNVYQNLGASNVMNLIPDDLLGINPKIYDEVQSIELSYIPDTIKQLNASVLAKQIAQQTGLLDAHFYSRVTAMR